MTKPEFRILYSRILLVSRSKCYGLYDLLELSSSMDILLDSLTRMTGSGTACMLEFSKQYNFNLCFCLP